MDRQHGKQYRCFVSGFGPHVDSHALAAAFQPCGALEAKVTINQYSGKGEGFGYVMFGDEETMREAILLMNKTEISGRRIKVMETTDAPESSTKWKISIGADSIGPSIANSGSSGGSLPSTSSSDKSRGSGGSIGSTISLTSNTGSSSRSGSSLDWFLRSFNSKKFQEENVNSGGPGPDASDGKKTDSTRMETGSLERRAIGIGSRSTPGALERRAMAFGSIVGNESDLNLPVKTGAGQAALSSGKQGKQQKRTTKSP